MVCVHCGQETKVVNSRLQSRLNQVWRRRKCLACGAIFTTEEKIDYASSWVVRSRSGKLSPFSRDKLLVSLFRSLGHRKNALNSAAGLTDTIMNKLMPLVQKGALDSSQIAQTAQVALNRFDKAASVHYQAFHASSRS